MSARHTASQPIHISGWECGTEIELKMVVEFTVTDAIPQTLENPAEPSMVEIGKVRFFDGTDELQLPWSIADRFTNEDGFRDWLMSEAIDADEYARDQAADARREELREDRL